MRMQFDDKLGHRGLYHKNLIAVRLPDGRQIIFEFAGKAVPGVVQIVREDYTSGGKWSHSCWEVELADGVIGFVRRQEDWETSQWLNGKRWPEAIAEFQGKESLDADAVERFIRITWQGVAANLDAAASEKADGSAAALLKLLEEQDALAKELSALGRLRYALAKELSALGRLREEVAAMEEAERAMTETIATRARVTKAREAMQRGASLSDLRALLS